MVFKSSFSFCLYVMIFLQCSNQIFGQVKDTLIKVESSQTCIGLDFDLGFSSAKLDYFWLLRSTIAAIK